MFKRAGNGFWCTKSDYGVCESIDLPTKINLELIGISPSGLTPPPPLKINSEIKLGNSPDSTDKCEPRFSV